VDELTGPGEPRQKQSHQAQYETQARDKAKEADTVGKKVKRFGGARWLARRGFLSFLSFTSTGATGNPFGTGRTSLGFIGVFGSASRTAHGLLRMNQFSVFGIQFSVFGVKVSVF
jgi:hypothetical protein